MARNRICSYVAVSVLDLPKVLLWTLPFYFQFIDLVPPVSNALLRHMHKRGVYTYAPLEVTSAHAHAHTNKVLPKFWVSGKFTCWFRLEKLISLSGVVFVRSRPSYGGALYILTDVNSGTFKCTQPDQGYATLCTIKREQVRQTWRGRGEKRADVLPLVMAALSDAPLGRQKKKFEEGQVVVAEEFWGFTRASSEIRAPTNEEEG